MAVSASFLLETEVVLETTAVGRLGSEEVK